MSSLNTDFNVSPYYDDYDQDKKFHRVLFKPAVALQARELTQLQTILQAQVERFGNNIYKEGTIIEGCQINLDSDYDFVKVADVQTDGQPVAPSTYLNCFAKGSTSNVVALVQQYADGLVSQAPNLTTLYIDYITTGLSGAKTFSTSENIEIYSDAALTTLVGTVTAAGAQVADASTVIGQGFAVTCSEGIIYSKGHFLQVDEGIVVASKYTDKPDNVSVGFDVSETVVTSAADSSLLDNASGYNNENAPGADRLKLNPFLVAIPTQDAIANSKFMAVMDFQNGLPIAKRIKTQFNVINDEMAQRTKEESGNYTIRKNSIQAEPISANTTHFNLLIGPGLHYVDGYRAEQFNTTRIPVQKASAFANVADQTITQNMGNYIVVNELVGGFASNTITEVSLRDTAGTSLTDGDNLTVAPGAEIGTAKVRGFEHHNGVNGTAAARFKVYLFDIKMNAGQAFRNVRALHSSGNGTGDVVLSNNRARLKEPRLSSAIYGLPQRAVKATSSSDYIYRTEKQVSTSTNTISLSTVTGVFPYSGSLSNSQKKEFVIRPTTIAGGIANNVAIDTDKISISVSSSTATIDLTDALASGITTSKSFNITFNEKKTNVTPLKKTQKTVYIKIDAATHSAGASGPWSLGLPDVTSIKNVWIGSTFANTNTESKSGFNLEKNCFDTHYGLSAISKKSSQSVGASDKLLVEAEVFEAADPASGAGFFTVSSYYQSDGVTLLEPENIPVYESSTGATADLRDILDARPQVANTAAFATTIAAANTNPADTEAFGSIDHFIPAPNKQFETNIEYYLGRIDKLLINQQGYVTTKRGAPASRPVPPPDVPNSLTLGTVIVPPYPSLTSKEARTKLRSNESVVVQQENTQRYTMAQIAKLDKRLKNIEYYTALSQLEQKTQNMAITDENGNDRFKNGIFVDPATDFNSADLRSREFAIGIDPTATEFIPKFKQEMIDLKVANSTNTVELSGVHTLEAKEESFLSQGTASNFRPCTAVFYKYTGKIMLDPQYDAGYDETVTGTKDVFIDSSTGMQDLLDGINELYPLTKTNIEKIGTSTDIQTETDVTTDTDTINHGYYGWRGYYGYDYYGHHGYYGGYGYGYHDYYGGWYGGSTDITTETATTTTTTTTTDTYLKTTQQLSMGYEESTQPVGDFVTDISFSPFMRSRIIKIIATGLRPSTRHYFFFDNTDINAQVAPGKVDSASASSTTLLDNPKNVFRNGGFNAAVTSDEFGVLLAVFKLPPETFNVGDRQLVISDVSSIASLDSSTSQGSATYNAYNYSVDKESVTVTTRTPTFDYSSSSDTFEEQTINIDTDTTVTNTYAYNYWWENDYFNYIHTDTVGANQDSSNNQYYPYTSNNGVEVVNASSNSTTTGTGSSAQTAITGTGGGGGRKEDSSVHYMLK
jgi:hypothetical protein